MGLLHGAQVSADGNLYYVGKAENPCMAAFSLAE